MVTESRGDSKDSHLPDDRDGHHERKREEATAHVVAADPQNVGRVEQGPGRERKEPAVLTQRAEDEAMTIVAIVKGSRRSELAM